jgi:hypothetical protein
MGAMGMVVPVLVAVLLTTFVRLLTGYSLEQLSMFLFGFSFLAWIVGVLLLASVRFGRKR